MKIQTYESKIVSFVDQNDIPRELSDALYAMAMDDTYNILDMHDGDFYYRVPLTSSKKCVVDLVSLLPPEVVKENRFGIWFYQ